jgi:TonB family protein
VIRLVTAIVVLVVVVAGWTVPVGEMMPAEGQQIVPLPPARLPPLPPPPPPPELRRAAPCTPNTPCCPSALQQLSGPPCRVGCAPAPKKVHTASPDLTTLASLHPTGIVILELVINEQGVPVSSCVLRGVREDFDTAAQLATLKWRYEPKLLDGKPVGVVMTVTVTTAGVPGAAGREQHRP